MNRVSVLSVILLVTVLATSCRSVKEIKKETTYLRKPEQVIELTQANDLAYKTTTIKANIVLTEGKKKVSFKASIRMQKDSIIWSSLTLLGIAGARTLISQDSIKLVNYKDDYFITEPYQRLYDWLNTDLLSLTNLQNIMLGDWLYIADFEKYRLKLDEGDYLVSTLSERRLERDWVEKKLEKMDKKIEKQEDKESEKGIERLEKRQEKNPKKYEGLAMEFRVDPYDLKVKAMTIKDYYFDGELSATYSDFQPINEQLVPHKVELTMMGKERVDVLIEYTKIELNEEISAPFSIPKKYERVRL